MAGASKELDPSKPSPHVGSYGSVGSWIYSLAKKIIVVGTVYFVGYMGWSVAWLIGITICFYFYYILVKAKLG